MEQLTLKPAHQVGGTIKLPGSKSISNRTLLLAALSEGTTEIRDLLASDDTARMLEALETLGVKLEKIAENAASRVQDIDYKDETNGKHCSFCDFRNENWHRREHCACGERE